MRCTMLAIGAAVVVLAGTPPLAQAPSLHLNPVIEKLSQGKPFIGVNTADLSPENARTLARAPIDYVYVDMEHNPLNFDALHLFLMGMSDKAMVLRKANLQPNVALFARRDANTRCVRRLLQSTKLAWRSATRSAARSL